MSLDINIEEKINKMYNSKNGMIDTDLHLNWSPERIKELNTFYLEGIVKHGLPINFVNKTIIDYGCGGGWLCKFLYSVYNIKKYIGIDIAERSINFANKNIEPLKDKINIEIIKINPLDILKKIKRKKFDIFISVACIQHFINQEYLDSFLDQLNNLKFEWIILQYHFNTKFKKTKFRNKPYETIRDVAYSCYTTPQYIEERLFNFSKEKVIQNVRRLERDFIYLKRKTQIDV